MSRASGLGPMPGWGGGVGGDLCGGSLQNVFSKRLPDVRSSTVRDNCGSEVASGEICSEKCCVSDPNGTQESPQGYDLYQFMSNPAQRGRRSIGVFCPSRWKTAITEERG